MPIAVLLMVGAQGATPGDPITVGVAAVTILLLVRTVFGVRRSGLRRR